MGVLPAFLGLVIWLNQPEPEKLERERWERARHDWEIMDREWQKMKGQFEESRPQQAAPESAHKETP